MPFRLLVLILGLLVVSGCQGPRPRWMSFSPGNRKSSKPDTSDLKDPVRTHLAYARLSEQTGKLDDARVSYETVLEEDAKSVDALLGLARLDLLGGRHNAAEQGFLKAMQAKPDDPHVIEATSQFYMSQDRYDDAVKQLLRGVTVAPLDKRLRYKLGMALARQGQVEAAEPHFVQAVGEAEANYNIGVILYEQGDVDSAEQRFLKAVLRKPTLAQAQHWLDVVRQERQAQVVAAGIPTGAPSMMETASATGVPPQQRLIPQQSPPPQLPLTSNPAMNTVAAPLPAQPSQLQLPAPQVHRSLPDPASMTAAQLEQLENSMTAAERAQLREQLKHGNFNWNVHQVPGQQ